MSDNGYGGGYDPYSFYGGVNAYDPYAGLGNNLYDYSYTGTPAANLGYSGGGATGGLYDTPAASYGGGGADSSNPYYLGDSGGGANYGGTDTGGTRDFWDRAGDWLAKPSVQRGFAQLGGLGQGLLQGSGPSLQPRNFYSALGQGMQGAQTAGAAYDTSQLSQAQLGKVGAETANLRTQSILDQQLAAEGDMLRNYPGGGMAGGGSGTSGAPAAAPTSAGYGGGAPATGGGFAAVEPHIFQYENATKNPYIGTGGTDLSKAPLSDTGFPQWSGIPTPQGRSTAAGLYQITQSTWDPIATQLGIKDFSPESQRKVAEELYNQRGLQPWLVGNPAFRNAAARGLVPGQAGSAAMAGGNVAAPLRDTPFQMPSNMAAGLGEPQAAPGLLPRPAPPPAAAIGPQAGGPPPAMGLPQPVAPAATVPALPPAAAAPQAGGPQPVLVAEGAGNLTSVNRNLKDNPDYYRGKVVVLAPTGGKTEQVPDQIDRIQAAGGQPILQAGIGKYAKANDTLSRIAAQKGVPFRGPSGESTGGGIPVDQTSAGANAGAGQDVSTPSVSPAAVSPAPPAPPPGATAAPGGLTPGGALNVPAVPGATVVPAPALPPAGLAMRTGTAPGVPQPLPTVPPIAAAPAAMPPAPPPGAAVPAAGAAPAAGAPAAGAPAAVMPGAIPPLPAVPPLPGQQGANPMAGIDPNWVRLNQHMAALYAARGRQVPGYIAKAAELPIAGMQAAAVKAAEQPYVLQSAQNNALLDAWKAGPIAAAQVAATQPYELQKIFAKDASQLQREWDTPQPYNYLGTDGNFHQDYRSPRQMAGGQGPEILQQQGAAGAPPVPAGTQAPGTPPAGASPVTKLGPVPEARIEGDKTAWTAVNNQYMQANNLRPLLDQVIDMANKTPSGWSIPVTQFLAGAIKGLGLPVTESMSNLEVMKTISQALIPTVRQPGSQSNAEMTNYLNTVPGLAQSPAGRIQIANMNKAMIDRLGDIAEVRRANLGAGDLDAKLKVLDTKPLFTPAQKASILAAQGRPIDKATYDLLPPGLDYVDPKGVKRTKPAAAQ